MLCIVAFHLKKKKKGDFAINIKIAVFGRRRDGVRTAL